MPREQQLDKKPIPCESIFIMAAHGAIIQYDLDPKFIASELNVDFSWSIKIVSHLYEFVLTLLIYFCALRWSYRQAER